MATFLRDAAGPQTPKGSSPCISSIIWDGWMSATLAHRLDVATSTLWKNPTSMSISESMPSSEFKIKIQHHLHRHSPSFIAVHHQHRCWGYLRASSHPEFCVKPESSRVIQALVLTETTFVFWLWNTMEHGGACRLFLIHFMESSHFHGLWFSISWWSYPLVN